RRLLLLGKVSHDLSFSIQAVLLHYADYSHDRERLLDIKPEVLSERIPFRPESFCEFSVDEDCRRSFGCVVFIEKPALEQRDFHRSEVIRTCGSHVNLEFLALWRRVSFDTDPAPPHRAR